MWSPVTENDDRKTNEPEADEIQQAAPPKPPEVAFETGGRGHGDGNGHSTTKPKVVYIMQTKVKKFKKLSAKGTATTKQPKIKKKEQKPAWKTISLRCTVPGCVHMIPNESEEGNQVRKSLNRHIRECHNIVPYPVCLDCNDKYWNLPLHLNRQHQSDAKQAFRCRRCPTKRFETYLALKKHHQAMHEKGSFRCLHCPFVGARRNDVCWHFDREHTGKPRKQCAFEGCNRTFKYPNQLKDHHFGHLNLKNICCTWPECTYRANHKATVMYHIKSQHLHWRSGQRPLGDNDDDEEEEEDDDDKDKPIPVNNIAMPEPGHFYKVLGLSEALRDDAPRKSLPDQIREGLVDGTLMAHTEKGGLLSIKCLPSHRNAVAAILTPFAKRIKNGQVDPTKTLHSTEAKNDVSLDTEGYIG